MAFLMNGETYETMMDMARALNRSRIYRKDFDKFGIVELVDEPTTDAGLDADDMVGREYPGASEEVEEVESATEGAVEAPPTKDGETVGEKVEEAVEVTEKALELRELAGYSTILEWAKDMKRMTADEVFDLSKSLGVTWSRHDNKRIDRMRAVAALRESMFPGEKRPRGLNHSPWRGVPTIIMVELCKENSIDFPETEDERVKRMHMARSLKRSGVNPPKA